MRGVWVWPESEPEQEKMLEEIKNSHDLLPILSLVAKSKDGLSNAQIDQMTRTNAQWNTLWNLRELMALGMIDYKVDIFGDAGKYSLTEFGRTVIQKLTAQPQQTRPVTSSSHQ